MYIVFILTPLDLYDEAEKKFYNLTKQNYVFTSDPKISAKEKSLIEKSKYKFRTIKNNQNLFDNAQYDMKK